MNKKPSMRIEELYRGEEGLSKMMTDDEIEKALLWRKIVAITDYLDEQAESQEPKALEEKECCHERWVSGECSPYCKNNPVTHGVWPAKPQEEMNSYGYKDHAHCPEKDSPCGINGKHRCCLCGKQVQEEPKKCCGDCEAHATGCGINADAEDGFGRHTPRTCEVWCADPDCLCHQKETEPKEVSNNEPNKGMYIILPRPKGKSSNRISEALVDFQEYCGDKEVEWWKLMDKDFIKLWSEFLRSLEK